MSLHTDGTPPLPEELRRALDDAIDQSLGALDTLRRTLRRHVRSERARGVTLDNIDRELRSLVARAEKSAKRQRRTGGRAASAPRAAGDDGADGTGDLTTQVIRWSGTFFRATPSADGTE